MLKRFHLFWVGLFLFLFIVPSSHSCKCMALDVSAQFQKAALVFTGKIVKITETGKIDKMFSEKEVLVEFVVDKQWKGEHQEKITLKTVQNASSCAGYNFKNDMAYLVFADKNEDNSYDTSLCSGTKFISDAAEDIKNLDSIEIINE